MCIASLRSVNARTGQLDKLAPLIDLHRQVLLEFSRCIAHRRGSLVCEYLAHRWILQDIADSCTQAAHDSWWCAGGCEHTVPKHNVEPGQFLCDGRHVGKARRAGLGGHAECTQLTAVD